ncbi:SDR family oxidoreductase [Nocardioides marmoriginsengisoli]|uniref:SDR family oxidoreductase n=1 Tax=Nocardioides marmoriginsengisoli TaxID=661483 RepID=A0A3N0CFS9_9ACTN|nr:SDR family oxidoreductase [Nocardioides marmoriginsengisoli]RNL62149.1 SDR family oxidoreductase [Nocardioides marmoriginsengisoli]
MTGLAWVAGAEGGIGAAVRARLEAESYRVHGSDRPDEDVALPGVAARVAADLSARGDLEVAVHAVGMSARRYGDGPLSTCTLEAWEEAVRVNLTSAFQFLQACLVSASDGARLVLIGSALAHGYDPDFDTVAYRISKGSLEALVGTAAREGAARGIRVNLVSPGLVETPMAHRALRDPRIADRLGELMPLHGQAASAETVAEAVAWLAGDASAFTTGAVVPVDGGWRVR